MTVRFSCFDTLQLTWLFRRFVSDRSTFAIDNYTSTESAVVGLTFEGAVMTSGLGWRRDMRALLEDRGKYDGEVVTRDRNSFYKL